MRRRRLAGVALLTALVVVAVSPGGPALAGATDADPGSAHSADGRTDVTAAVAAADYDRRLQSARTHWTGQRLYFDGSDVVADVGNASAGQRTFQLRRVTDGDDVGRLVREFVVDADGEAVVRTGSLEGEFVVRYDGEPVYVQDGTGYAASPPDGTAVTVENSAWEVAVQTLTSSWSDERVSRNEIVALRLESNRVRYLVAVSADGLPFEDLESIFDPHVYANDHDARADEDVIVLRGGSDVDFPAYFAGIDDGEYTFVLAVTDADVATMAHARVGRARTATTSRPTETATRPPGTTATTTTAGTTPSGPTATSSPTAATSAKPATTTPAGQPGFDAIGGAIALLSAVTRWGRRR